MLKNPIQLIQHLLADQRRIYRSYVIGALLFFVGIGLIQWADKAIEPSLEQEAHMLLGVFVCGAGFFTAMLSQLLLIVYRMKNMGNDK